MKLFAVVVLVLACFPVLLDCFSSARRARYPALDYPTGTPALSAALNSGSAGVNVPASVHPNNRGCLVSTAVPITLPHPVPSHAKAPFHLNLGHWLRNSSTRFIGGVLAVFQYISFLIVGLAILRNQLVHGLPPQSELVVVPIPVGPAGPVIECRVPDARVPMPPPKPPRRPMVRRPLLDSSILRVGGPKKNSAPRPVTPAQPPHRGTWIELMTVEGKLILCSHHTGRGSVEWTVQYFPCRDYRYYLSQYPATPRVNPIVELLLSSRPLVVKGPGAIMEEVCDYLFSTSGAEPEVDVTSAPLPLSTSESPDTSNTQGDSDSNAVVLSTADADANSVEAGSFSLLPPELATRRRHSYPNLQTHSAHAPSQQYQFFRRASVAGEQMARLSFSRSESPDTSIDMPDSSNTRRDSDSDAAVPSTADVDANSVEAGSFSLLHPELTTRRRHSLPNLRTHASCQPGHPSRRASVAGEPMAQFYFSRSETPDSSDTQRESDSEAVVSPTPKADANSVEAGYFSPPRLEPASRRRHSCPDLRTQFSHAPSLQVHRSRRVSIAVDQRARLRLVREERQLSHEKEAAMKGSARRGNINEELKFKFRRGGKRNTARKHKRLMQEQDQRDPGLVLPPHIEILFSTILSSTSDAY